MDNKSVLRVFASFVMSVFFFSGCTPTTYTNDPFWNEVTDYFTDTARTKKELLDRMDPYALEQLIPQSNMDTAGEIVELFATFKDDHNYKIEKMPDSVYLCFNPYVEVAPGPIFEIKRSDSSWKVMAVLFGK
jgi:hypothetical protein